MTKSELIEKVAMAANVSKSEASTVIGAYEHTVTTEVKGLGYYRIAGLGTIKGAIRPSRTGRNPQTGETITIPEKKVVKFKTATDFDR